MSKQTPVEWFVEQLKKQGFLYDLDIEQALAMEREQIKEAYSTGLRYGMAHYIVEVTDEEADPANYYQRTYGKEATDANAARIVACINSCAGMADPAAEIAELKAEREWNNLLRMDIEEKENIIVEYHTEVESLKQRIAELEKEADHE